MCRVGKTYIYTHIFKCGGTSVHNTLQKLDNTSKMMIGGHLDTESIRNHHIKHDMLDQFDNKFKFAVVRNPYDWIASTYYYIKRSRGHDLNKKMMNQSINQFVDWFIDEAIHQDREEYQNKYLTQKQYLTEGREINGKVIVDYFTKMEELDKNWKYILEKIGLPYTQLGNVNKNPHKKKTYKGDFNDAAIKRIQETFKEDFKFFGYDM
tara:strand:+ start:336 stop:959 length:624 start_codon:yes stop_codon:yes gene_type:complete